MAKSDYTCCASRVDWRAMFVKYAAVIREYEGSDYLSKSYGGSASSLPDWTDEEFAAIRAAGLGRDE